MRTSSTVQARTGAKVAVAAAVVGATLAAGAPAAYAAPRRQRQHRHPLAELALEQ